MMINGEDAMIDDEMNIRGTGGLRLESLYEGMKIHKTRWGWDGVKGRRAINMAFGM